MEIDQFYKDQGKRVECVKARFPQIEALSEDDQAKIRSQAWKLMEW